ncbi:MAG TPA: class I SAM-dependent methyltransferase [Thermoleophilaceae bacterium]|nr:class I SAM-dependent methyltransferase [Thermoleophilaceae bacterium]
MGSALTWQSDDRCTAGGITFQLLPVGLLARENPALSMKGADFLLMKEPPMVQRYADIIEQVQPRRIVELGVFQGGSTALFLELADPEMLVAIDHNPKILRKLREYLSSRPERDAVARVYDDVDQGDRARLADIVEDAFGDQPLDLVIDDCSHLYELTRASFNELFPRLRPGGVYAIEDWRWAHGDLSAYQGVVRDWPDGVPMSKLVLELVLALPGAPGLISDLKVEATTIQITRGDAEADPGDFQISAFVDANGQALLGA